MINKFCSQLVLCPLYYMLNMSEIKALFNFDIKLIKFNVFLNYDKIG